MAQNELTAIAATIQRIVRAHLIFPQTPNNLHSLDRSHNLLWPEPHLVNEI